MAKFKAKVKKINYVFFFGALIVAAALSYFGDLFFGEGPSGIWWYIYQIMVWGAAIGLISVFGYVLVDDEESKC
jgi:hypothetical protein